MQAQLTEFLLRLTFEGKEKSSEGSAPAFEAEQHLRGSSAQIITNIYEILNSQKNYKAPRNHKPSFSSEETNGLSPVKCNCKKSKCLKLYCECFAKGSFCKDCNCECCQNTDEFSEVRAKAIDDMLTKSSAFGYKQSSSGKGCSCKKTGCIKKYCECFSLGISCNGHCKCSNCENDRP